MLHRLRQLETHQGLTRLALYERASASAHYWWIDEAELSISWPTLRVWSASGIERSYELEALCASGTWLAKLKG